MVGALLKEGAQDEAVAETSPAFWECLPTVGFTHLKAEGERYHELKHMCRGKDQECGSFGDEGPVQGRS